MTMTPSTAQRPHAPPLPVIAWWITALVCWGGFLVSLPGYYLWYIKAPILRQFTDLKVILTLAGGMASILCALVSLSLATFLFIRKPGDRPALFVSFYLLLYGLIMSGPLEMMEFSFTGQSGRVSFPIQGLLFTAPAIIMMLVFPNGVVTPARFRWMIPFALFLSLLMGTLPSAEYNQLVTTRSQLINGYAAILLLLALGAQVYRYFWKSSPVERQQTKIVIFGFFLQMLLFGLSSIVWYQISPIEQGSPSEFSPTAFMWWAALAILPISLTIAIIRSRLWDIDFVIRRTLVYAFLSITLALIYFGGVVMMQSFFRVIFGHESNLAIIISTLAIAALFTPLRSSLQALIDRRFYRRKYNVEQALTDFQFNLRDQTNLEAVENELTGIVQSTVQPEWVALWIRKRGV